jgi:hypothetical protein
MAIWSVAQIGVIPPRLEPRALEMASAATHVIVDTPRSSILDLRQDTYSLEALRQRAVVLGNVMAEGQVRQAIEDRSRVPAGALQVTPPLTPEQPRVVSGSENLVSGSENRKHTTDIVRSTDQYRLSIQTNPTVPIMDIYSQAPSAETAEDLANGAVVELRRYLADLALAERTPEADQVHLVQLGKARGEVINEGIEWQVAMLAFLLTFLIACATVIFFARLKQGWRATELSDRSVGG